jgi:histidinol-phosphate aminotransferase
MSIAELARPEVRRLKPYVAAAARDGVRLHANEAPWRQTWDKSPVGLNRYPPPWPGEVANRLAALYGVEPHRVAVGRGSDELIDLAVRIFCRAGEDAVVVCPPTFGMYRIAAELQGAAVREVALERSAGFALNVAALLDACDAHVRLVFLCSPNNPTGNALEGGQVTEIAAALRDRALVVLDEAYVEFSRGGSLVRELAAHPNLLLLRTLSKAHALAGARVGAALGDPEVIALLRAVTPPYALPTPSIRAVLQTLTPGYAARLEERVAMIREQRARLAAGLGQMQGVRRVWPSDANFLLVEMRDAAAVVERAAAAGLLLRDFSSHPQLTDCVRITVSDAAQNERLLEVLEGALYA